MSDAEEPRPRRGAPAGGDDLTESDLFRPTTRARRFLPPEDEVTAIFPKAVAHESAPIEATSSKVSAPERNETAPGTTHTKTREPLVVRVIGIAVPAFLALAMVWSATSLVVNEGAFSLNRQRALWLGICVVATVALWLLAMRRQLKQQTMRRSVLLTALSALLPGLGLLGAKQRSARAIGILTAGACIVAVGALAVYAILDLNGVASLAVSRSALSAARYLLLALALLWVVLITGTHLITRPKKTGTRSRAVGAAVVAFLSFAIAAPLSVASQYTVDAQNLVTNIFADEDDIDSDSRPTIDHEQDNPWEGIPRLNVMLLGGDGGTGRDESLGIRTDTIMVASIDTVTGDTTIIQIPRNVQYTPFPRGSEMAELFPEGFTGGGESAYWYINALWERTETEFLDVFPGKTYRGAEALKQGVEGITGLDIDYFVLLDMDGLQQLIDAMGGVTVNINQHLPMGPANARDWLEPGPDQKLNGREAMWYARSRSTTSDYDRMARQSCLVNAIIDQANPSTMLRSFEGIAAASANMVITDIPQQVLQPLVGLSLNVQGANVTRVVFTPGTNGYDYANPDFVAMRRAVHDGIQATSQQTPAPTPTSQQPTDSPSPTEEPTEDPTAAPTVTDGAQNVTDACAYNP